MRNRLAIMGLVLFAISSVASAQLGWDKHRPTKALPNPSPVNGTREQIAAHVKTLLSRNDVKVKDEGVDAQNGSYVITTEPVVFARGLISGTQLGHFAETKNPGLQEIVRGRVTLKIEIAPATTTSSKVGVYGTFEGQRAGSPTWVGADSRGILEDRVMRYLVTAVAGKTLEEADDDLLDASGGGQ